MVLGIQEDFSEEVVILLRLDGKTRANQIHERKQEKAEKTHTSGDADMGGVGRILCGSQSESEGRRRTVRGRTVSGEEAVKWCQGRSFTALWAMIRTFIFILKALECTDLPCRRIPWLVWTE